ncbi:MAG: oligosaccharide flippase family protein [Clostridia bacterium]|nr:oligosaccharide flippase family protein [Clostridia bacterium]
MEQTKQFRKNFIWNIIGTGFSSFNSLFFLIIVTRINGVENGGIFTLAFSTACILYMIGIYAGRIYQVTENDTSITNKDYIVNRLISCIIAIFLIIPFVLIRQYDLYKASIFIILTIYKALEAFSEVMYGILQKNNFLDKAGKSGFIKSLVSILLFIIIDLVTKNMIIACLSVVFVYLLTIVFYDLRQVKSFVTKEEKVSKKNVISIFKNGFFPFVISFLGVYMVNAQKYAIDGVLTDDIQAIFGIIIMPATVMGLLSQFLIHPYLNKIFELHKTGQYLKIKRLIYKIILIIFAVGILCTGLGYLLGTPVLGLIYSLDLSQYTMPLTIILIAATFYTMAGILSPILITMRYNFVQFVVYGLISIFEWILSQILVTNFGFNGAVWAYIITMIVYFIVFYIVAMVAINKSNKKYNGKEEK